MLAAQADAAGPKQKKQRSKQKESTPPDQNERAEEEEKAEAGTTVAQSSSTEEDGDKKPAAQESSSKASAEESGASTKKPDMPAYCVNLDPATLNVPYNPSIDIRDTVDYKVRQGIQWMSTDLDHSWICIFEWLIDIFPHNCSWL